MSRIGKLPISVPAGVEVNLEGQHITVKGPKGELSYTAPELVELTHEDGVLTITRVDDSGDARAQHGLARSLVNNLVVGVTDGFERKLEIVGTGYRVIAKGDTLEFSLGYSHPVTMTAPEGITFNVESPTKLSVVGIDKQLVGEIAANIRKLRSPEPYKGKGVRYEGEIVRRKVGKAGK